MEGKYFRYRVTGPQSIERLDPLIRAFAELHGFLPIATVDATTTYDFVWETTCEINQRGKHKDAFIINKLHNSTVIESKANQAFLQLGMKVPVLETYVSPNAMEVRKWCSNYWGRRREAHSCLADWWVLKASNGNGGKDIWLLDEKNFHTIVDGIQENEEYVLQR
jgi:hypothetical protein